MAIFAQFISHICDNGLAQCTGALIMEGPKERSTHIRPMPQLFQILKDEAARSAMQRNIRCLSILAGNLQLSDSAALMLEILDQKLTKLFTLRRDRAGSPK